MLSVLRSVAPEDTASQAHARLDEFAGDGVQWVINRPKRNDDRDYHALP